MTGASVTTAGLAKTFGAGRNALTALQDVDLQVAPGEMLAVMGPSGSGKSTLLHLLGAMDSPTAGTIRVGAWEVDRLRGARAALYRRHVGFVFQRFHLLGALTALDNVLAPVLPFRHPSDPEPRARQLLERVGLGGRATALPCELSGGEQQRVAIARALINDPHLVLADEPTGNLDSVTGGEIVHLLTEIRGEGATTLVIATHDESVARDCDRIVQLADGHLLADGHHRPSSNLPPSTG
ncbi:MAG: ABC transporter ATP-binding protein [Acidimicrobiales bacterium]